MHPRGVALFRRHCGFGNMFALFLVAFLLCGVCDSDDEEIGFGLHIGHSIDVFANYGDLSQVTQVISGDYEDEEEDQTPTEPFRELNVKVFTNVTSKDSGADSVVDMNILLCDTFENLLTTYYQNFKIEGTDKPWKAFMGNWALYEIQRTFGISTYDTNTQYGRYVLVKLSKVHRSVTVEDLTYAAVKSNVQQAVDELNVSDTSEIRRFMKSYGTHYIESYKTGNFVYQVFQYKKKGYELLKSYIKLRQNHQMTSETLRFYFSSYFLKEIGEIRIASGNKSVELWARDNLNDIQYLFSRPSLLRLHYNHLLAYKLNGLLDNGALLGLSLKTLRPLFKDRNKAEKFAEVVENDMKLWDVNS